MSMQTFCDTFASHPFCHAELDELIESVVPGITQTRLNEMPSQVSTQVHEHGALMFTPARDWEGNPLNGIELHLFPLLDLVNLDDSQTLGLEEVAAYDSDEESGRDAIISPESLVYPANIHKRPAVNEGEAVVSDMSASLSLDQPKRKRMRTGTRCVEPLMSSVKIEKAFLILTRENKFSGEEKKKPRSNERTPKYGICCCCKDKPYEPPSNGKPSKKAGVQVSLRRHFRSNHIKPMVAKIECRPDSTWTTFEFVWVKLLPLLDDLPLSAFYQLVDSNKRKDLPDKAYTSPAQISNAALGAVAAYVPCNLKDLNPEHIIDYVISLPPASKQSLKQQRADLIAALQEIKRALLQRRCNSVSPFELGPTFRQ